jgi:hypothetical protein
MVFCAALSVSCTKTAKRAGGTSPLRPTCAWCCASLFLTWSSSAPDVRSRFVLGFLVCSVGLQRGGLSPSHCGGAQRPLCQLYFCLLSPGRLWHVVSALFRTVFCAAVSCLGAAMVQACLTSCASSTAGELWPQHCQKNKYVGRAKRCATCCAGRCLRRRTASWPPSCAATLRRRRRGRTSSDPTPCCSS